MLYLRISPRWAFIINEYWVLVPLMLAIDIAVIVNVKKNRARKKKQYSQKFKQLQIFHIATGNLLAALKVRGREKIFLEAVENYIEVAYPNCIVGKGLRYINNTRLRKLVYSLFKSKVKNGVIYITKTALCHLVEMYSLDLPALAVPVPDFIGVFSWCTLERKIISVAALGIPLPMIILAQGPLAIVISLVAGSFGIFVMTFTKDPGFTMIPTDLIFGPIGSIRRRMPNQPNIVSIDLEPVRRYKITMSGLSESEKTPYECFLPNQMITNPKCNLRLSEIADIVGNTDTTLNYKDVVNMQDATKLKTVDFSDKFEVFPPQKSTSKVGFRGTKNFCNSGKTVNFLDKFRDSEFVPDTQKWDNTISIPQNGVQIPADEL